jgi:hypothetical protein
MILHQTGSLKTLGVKAGVTLVTSLLDLEIPADALMLPHTLLFEKYETNK